jgi:hypothetical protein
VKVFIITLISSDQEHLSKFSLLVFASHISNTFYATGKSAAAAVFAVCGREIVQFPDLTG